MVISQSYSIIPHLVLCVFAHWICRRKFSFNFEEHLEDDEMIILLKYVNSSRAIPRRNISASEICSRSGRDFLKIHSFFFYLPRHYKVLSPFCFANVLQAVFDKYQRDLRSFARNLSLVIFYWVLNFEFTACACGTKFFIWEFAIHRRRN